MGRRKSETLKLNREGYWRLGKHNQHILISETALGHKLPKGAEVHHVNGDRADNSRGNLVVCQDRTYHKLLHRRADAIKYHGSKHALRCSICHQWDRPGENTMVEYWHRNGSKKSKLYQTAHHRSCKADSERERKRRIRASTLCESPHLRLCQSSN